MGRLSKFLGSANLLLVLGSIGFSQQVDTTSGVAVVNNSPSSTAPIVAPPLIALPGSGTPTGVPVQVGVNDPRGGSGYVKETSVVSGVESFVITPPTVSLSAGGSNSAAAAVGNTRPSVAKSNGPAGFRAGIGAESSSSISAANRVSTATVADAAAQFKARKANIRGRMITNQDIYALNLRNNNGGVNANSESMPQSDVAGSGDAVSNGVLDQRDLDAVNMALARSRAKQAAKEKAESAEQSGQVMPPAAPKQ